MSRAHHDHSSTNPAELAEMLPFLLDVYPDDGMVLRPVYGASVVGGITLTTPIPADQASWQSTAETFVRQFLDASQDRGGIPDKVVIYLCREPTPAQDADEAAELLRPLAEQLANACAHHGIPVLESLGLIAGRWWSYACDRLNCCNGKPLPPLDDPNSLTTRMLILGRSPAPRAHDIAAEFQPPTAEAAPEQWLATLNAQAVILTARTRTSTGTNQIRKETRQLIEAALDAFRDGVTELDDSTTARIILGLQDRETRDQAFEYAEDDQLPTARRLWAFLARRCVPPHTDIAPPLLTLLAWTAWRQDDIPSARVALRHALTIEPSYTLAKLLHAAINEGVDSQPLLEMVRDDRAERLAGARDDNKPRSR